MHVSTGEDSISATWGDSWVVTKLEGDEIKGCHDVTVREACNQQIATNLKQLAMPVSRS